VEAECGAAGLACELVFDEFDQALGFGDGLVDREFGAAVVGVFQVGEVACGEDGGGDGNCLRACGCVHGFAPARNGESRRNGDSILAEGLVLAWFRFPRLPECLRHSWAGLGDDFDCSKLGLYFVGVGAGRADEQQE